MDKSEFFEEQVRKFRDYAKRLRNRDLASLFDNWAESKDFSEQNRQAIFAKFLSQFVYKNKTNG